MKEFWKYLIILFIIGLITGPLVKLFMGSPYPHIVTRYQYRYRQMSDQSEKDRLIAYTRSVMNDSIEGLNYTELLELEHRYLMYPSESFKAIWEAKVNTEGRPEEPIKILTSQFRVYIQEDERVKVMGKCGEFTLVYCGLLLANGIECRLVVDCSVKTDNRTVGDHVWVEVYVCEYKENLRQIIGKWLTIDPTENKIDQPDLYAVKWNKNVNRVYAITTDEIIDVTDTYKGVA